MSDRQKDRDRDNETGRYVSDDEADQRPDSTTSESVDDRSPGVEQTHRDDATGEFVPAEYAREHPDTTHGDKV